MIPLSPTLTPAQYAATKRALRLSEREIVAQVIGTDDKPGFVRAEGWEPIRIQSGTVRGVTRGTYMRLRPKKQKGIADWICVRGRSGVGRPAQFFFFEAKAPGKELSEGQVEWHLYAARMGFPCIVADGLGRFIEEYRRLGY